MATTICFFATEGDLPLQQPTQAFGPVSGNTGTQYRLSSLFTGSLTANKVMAHAVVGGRVLFLVSNSSPDRYNIILRPLEQIPGLPAVKYFIYRGILKSDFLDSSNTIVSGTTCQLKTVIAKSNNPMNALQDYAATAGTTSIDELFLKQTNQFATVNSGDSLGHFDNASGFDYGLDIVLDEPGYSLTVDVGRKSANVVDLAPIAGADAQEAARLQTLAYIDPAAYYGLCMHGSFEVKHNATGGPYKKEKVYNLVKKFDTKNRVYLDIRDTWGMPQGFIGATTTTIKVSQGAGDANGSTPVSYRGTDNWPLHVLPNSFTGSATSDGYKYFTLKLSLPPDGILLPLLQLQVGYWKKYFTEFRDEVRFSKLQITSGWTSDAAVAIIAATDGSATVPAATYVRVQLEDYANASALAKQFPEKQPFDREVFDLTGMYAPEWLNPPQFSAVTDPNIGTIVRMAPYLNYGRYKGAGIAFKTGAAIDQDGVVAFCIRGRHYMPLESNTDKQNDDIDKNEISTVLPLSSGEYPDSGFWSFIFQHSKYEYDYVSGVGKKNALEYKQRNTSTGVIKPYKIHLAAQSTNLLEIRLRDSVVIRGYDYSPAEPFVCLGYSTSERGTIAGIMNDPAKFAPVGPKFFVYDVQPVAVPTAGMRAHYRFTLHIKGLKYAGTQFVWTTEPTTIAFYSVDGENFFTNQYSTAVFARIAGTIWDNGSVPNAVAPTSNPYEAAGKYASGLKTALYNQLQTLLTTDPRLLDGEVRDEFYDDNLPGLSMQIAFRAPFFMEKPREIPYTNVTVNSVTVNNNPYKDNFDTWFAGANALRAMQTTPALGPLARTGLTQALTNAINADQDHLNLYAALGVTRNTSFANHHVPAYMARVMEDENPRSNYTSQAHLPANYTYDSDDYDSAGLDTLVTNGTISSATRTYLRGLGAAAFGWRALENPRNNARGYYIVKKSNSTRFHIVDEINWSNPNNNSGITIGLGFDMGQQDVASYRTYIAGLGVPHATDSEEAIGKSAGHAAALFRLFDIDIWNALDIPYDDAVQRTVPFMQTKFLGPMLSYLHTRHGAPQRLLKVYQQTGATAFYQPGGIQYFNEVEKMMLLSHAYNGGVASVSLTSERGKKFIHAVNTHDWRWLKIAWQKASVYANRKTHMQVFLDRTETMQHYDYTRTTL